MKPTENFKRVIQDYLQNLASTDTLFAQSFNKEGKSIDQCIMYIFSEVKKSGCNGFEDEEIFGMAVHYYDEDTIEITSNATPSRIITNHTVVLTEEEIAQAKKEALDNLIAEEQRRLRTKPTTPSKQPQATNTTLSLF
jgi:hypothetical protein